MLCDLRVISEHFHSVLDDITDLSFSTLALRCEREVLLVTRIYELFLTSMNIKNDLKQSQP